MPRTKGSPNRVTAKTKSLVSELILGQTDRIQEALDEVFECNKREYLQIMVRLLPYVMPKASDMSPSEPSERRKLSWFGN
jgi:hypothetical protein